MQCHIGPGANWFVKSKLSGLRQVYAVTFNTHSRPIPSPVTDLRPARDTCEQCHWPEKFHGDKVRVSRSYADDEQNTETVTTLRMHIGGINKLDKSATGIHWHVSALNQIEYIATDEKRQVIPYVRLDDGKGNVTEFRTDGFTDAQVAEARAAGRVRKLDCIDCHNRPSHTFAFSAERAVDEAIAGGGFDPKMPFIRREAVKVLKAPYADKPAAMAGIKSGLEQYYAANHPGTASRSGGSRRADGSAALRAQRLSDDEGRLGKLREQRRTQRPRAEPVPRVFPVPRREPQVPPGQGHFAGLQPLSHDRVGLTAVGCQSHSLSSSFTSCGGPRPGPAWRRRQRWRIGRARGPRAPAPPGARGVW